MSNPLEYNTERSRLIIPEYGRHIHKMIAYAVATPDKELRNKRAQAIIVVMGNLNPHLRDVPDFQHKLWDQLFIMSDFKLDVDAPYPKLTKDVLEQRPEPLAYPQNFPKYRFYGNTITKMIAKAISWEPGQEKDALCFAIANHMKKCYLNWNKDTVEDSVIFKHLLELSNGQIDLSEEKERLSQTAQLLKTRTKTNASKGSGKRQHSRSTTTTRNNTNRTKKRY